MSHTQGWPWGCGRGANLLLTLYRNTSRTLTAQVGVKHCGLACSKLAHSSPFEVPSLFGLYYTWHEHHRPPLQAVHQLSGLLPRLTSYITCLIWCFRSDPSLKFRSCGFKFKAFCRCLSGLNSFLSWYSWANFLSVCYLFIWKPTIPC